MIMKKTIEEEIEKIAKKMVVGEIIEKVLSEEEYQISGFGKFLLVKKKGRKFNNPIAGKYSTPDTFTIKFLPSKKLKRYITRQAKIKRGGKDG